MSINVDEITAALRKLEAANRCLRSAQEVLANAIDVERTRRGEVDVLQREVAHLMYTVRRDAPPDTLWDKGQAQ